MEHESELLHHVDRLYAAAIVKTGDSLAAEDIAQETLLAAWSSLSRGTDPDDMWAWLCRILSNKYCDWLREKYKKPTISFDLVPYEDIPDEDDDTWKEKVQQIAHIRRELGYLAHRHREVMLRFYIHNESIAQIAHALNIPTGTVKSRLNMGRHQIRKGMETMETLAKQCYAPERLDITCSGSCGINGEPFSLVETDDLLAQNLLILAYNKPVSETELARQLGVPTVFIEPVIRKLINGELMKRTDGGRVYTDFIIYSEKDRNANLENELAFADAHFACFWKRIEQLLSVLCERDYYKRHSENQRRKLMLHGIIKCLMHICGALREQMIGKNIPYTEYPHRSGGGKWFALGMHRSADAGEEAWWRYSIGGEAGEEIRGYAGTNSILLRKYETILGKYPNNYDRGEYLKWLYELYKGIPAEQSQVVWQTIEASVSMLENGVLLREDGLKLDIPVLTPEEYRDESRLAEMVDTKTLIKELGAIYSQTFSHGAVKLPPHLTSVPKWHQYMFCGGNIPMALVLRAMDCGKLFRDITCTNGSLPAAILVIDEG